MRSSGTFGVLVCLVVVGMLYADEAKIELVPVYEKTFDEPIVDVIFDTATVSIEEAKKMGWKEEAFSEEERQKGTARVCYPRVIFVSEAYYPDGAYRTEARIYDKEGNLLKRIKTRHHKENLIFSTNGRYILKARLFQEFEPSWKGGALYRNDGTKLWEKGEDGGFPRAVSNLGYVAALTYLWSSVEFGDYTIFDLNGQKLNVIENPYEGVIEGRAMVKFSQDGEHLLVGFADRYANSQFILTTKTGEVVWQEEYPYTFYDYEVIKRYGIAALFEKYLWGPDALIDLKTYISFIDWQGNLRWISPLEIRGDKLIKISKDQKRVYAMSSEGSLMCLKLDDGKILWHYKEPWAPKSGERLKWEVPLFCEFKIMGDFLYIIGKQGRNWHSSALFVFDGKSGQLLKKIEYPQEKLTFVRATERLGLINIPKGKVTLFSVRRVR